MEDIIAQISAKTGLNHDTARQAFLATVEVIKSKLPKSISDQLPGILTENKEIDFSALLKEKMKDFTDSTGEKISGLKDDAGEKLDDIKDSAQGLFNKVFK